MKRWIMCALLAVGSMSGEASADGNQLLTQCKAAIRSMDAPSTNEAYAASFATGMCFGKVTGILSISGIINNGLPANGKICPPEGMTMLQAVRITVKYMQENPKNLNLSDGVLILLAMQDAYPCN